MGAVGTTFIAGVPGHPQGPGQADRLAHPDGHDPHRPAHRQPHARSSSDYVPLAELDDLVFGGWDVFPDDAYVAASRAGVLDKHLLEQLGDELRAIQPMPAVFEQSYVQATSTATTSRPAASKMDQAEAADRRTSSASADENGCDRLVAVWCGSTEVYREPTAVHMSLDDVRAGPARLAPRHRAVADLRVRAASSWASRTPTARRTSASTSRRCSSSPASNDVPITGKDFKTGQTLMKTILAPGFKARMLGVEGWYSTNILGNRDGEVLDDPESFKSKEVSKLGVLDTILAARALPRALRRHPPRRAHQLLPAARRQQGGLGQHRHLRVARLPDADQGRLPLPRLDPRRADRARPRAVPRPRQAGRHDAASRSGCRSTGRARRTPDGRCTPSTTCSSSS